MTLYEKVYQNETVYRIRYNEGTPKYVNENQDLYQAWLAEGNTPDVAPFVPPTPLPLDQLRFKVFSRIQGKRQKTLSDGMVFESMDISTGVDSRELILGGSRKAKKNSGFTARAILADGSVVTLTNKQLKDLEDALDDFGDPIQETAVTEHETALTATRKQLDYYIEHGEFQ